MHRGYIKIYRKIEDSGLFQLPNTLTVFLYMLTKATHKPIRIGTANLQRGQFSTGRKELARVLKLSEQSVRTAIDHLKKLEMVTSEATSVYTIYTIVNYSIYQDIPPETNQPDNQPPTNEQPTSNQRATTKQEHKHISTQEHNSNTNVLLVTSDAVDCPHNEIIKIYSEVLPELPQPRIWEGQRMKNLSSRWKWVLSDLKKRNEESTKEAGVEFFRRMFVYISKSDLLMGRVGTWSTELGWIVKAENFTKIIQGNYENNKGKQ